MSLLQALLQDPEEAAQLAQHTPTEDVQQRIDACNTSIEIVETACQVSGDVSCICAASRKRSDARSFSERELDRSSRVFTRKVPSLCLTIYKYRCIQRVMFPVLLLRITWYRAKKYTSCGGCVGEDRDEIF